jgi:uncharacterized protein (TIGR02611 family)
MAGKVGVVSGIPFRSVWNFILKSSKRVAVTVFGAVFVAAGLAMMVLPGPGILVIIIGLAILATEYVWARRALQLAKDKAKQARSKAGGFFRRKKKLQ